MVTVQRDRLAVGLAAALLLVQLGGCNSNTSQQQMDEQHIEAQQAQVEQDKIDSTKPITAETHFAAGQLAQAQNDLPHAIEQYNAALKLDPNHANTLLNLGLLYVNTQQYQLALPIWQRYVTATHGSAAAYSDLGYCLELMGRPGDATNAYRAGIAADGKNQACRVNYGLLLARLGDMSGATEQLSAVLSSAEVHYDLASVLQSQGQIERARAEYEAALHSDPDMADAKARLAGMR
jgi:tetratricopeptide (TPR) repeat protein